MKVMEMFCKSMTLDYIEGDGDGLEKKTAQLEHVSFDVHDWPARQEWANGRLLDMPRRPEAVALAINVEKNALALVVFAWAERSGVTA